jgi:hypothetical protein
VTETRLAVRFETSSPDPEVAAKALRHKFSAARQGFWSSVETLALPCFMAFILH